MKNLTVDLVLKILEKEQARKNGGYCQRGTVGFLLEVDLEYPSELWKKHTQHEKSNVRERNDNVKSAYS